MHPVINQAIAAERARELQAAAITVSLARQLRRSRRLRLTPGIPGAGRIPAVLSARGPMRGPRAA